MSETESVDREEAASDSPRSIWTDRSLSPDAVLLTGKVAIVTGAAHGLGRAIALGMSRFGARLAVCDRQPERLADTAERIAAIAGPPLAVVLDVRDGAAVAEFVDRVVARFGTIDVLVNNAGGTFFGPFNEMSQNGEDTMVRENFGSVTSFIRTCVPLMSAGGSIINITSIEGHRAAPGFAVYAAMKAAVTNLSKSLSMELAPRRIRINCIAPDFVRTEGMATLSDSADVVNEDVCVTPWPEPGHPDDCAAAAVFLASDMSRFVTGSTIHLDGGTYAAHGWKIRVGGGFTL